DQEAAVREERRAVGDTGGAHAGGRSPEVMARFEGGRARQRLAQPVVASDQEDAPVAEQGRGVPGPSGRQTGCGRPDAGSVASACGRGQRQQGERRRQQRGVRAYPSPDAGRHASILASMSGALYLEHLSDGDLALLAGLLEGGSIEERRATLRREADRILGVLREPPHYATLSRAGARAAFLP